jgi:hypothetical protein
MGNPREEIGIRVRAERLTGVYKACARADQRVRGRDPDPDPARHLSGRHPRRHLFDGSEYIYYPMNAQGPEDCHAGAKVWDKRQSRGLRSVTTMSSRKRRGVDRAVDRHS